MMTPAKAKTGIGKTTSDWGVLHLFQVADGITLALKNLCSGGGSHHGDLALGDAKLGEDSLYCFTYARVPTAVG